LTDGAGGINWRNIIGRFTPLPALSSTIALAPHLPSFHKIWQASVDVTEPISTFQPASAAKLHAKCRALATHVEHTFVRRHIANEAWNAADCIHRRVIWVQSQLDMQLQCRLSVSKGSAAKYMAHWSRRKHGLLVLSGMNSSRAGVCMLASVDGTMQQL